MPHDWHIPHTKEILLARGVFLAVPRFFLLLDMLLGNPPSPKQDPPAVSFRFSADNLLI